MSYPVNFSLSRVSSLLTETSKSIVRVLDTLVTDLKKKRKKKERPYLQKCKERELRRSGEELQEECLTSLPYREGHLSSRPPPVYSGPALLTETSKSIVRVLDTLVTDLKKRERLGPRDT